VKILIVVMLVAIVAVLASAGVVMLRKPRDGRPHDARMARALMWRVLLSIGLFLFILLAWRLGWIQPSALPVSR
jgi:membrane protein CcdC involved in cytochrome C biogenesis